MRGQKFYLHTVGHVLSYIIYKFHVSTTFHWKPKINVQNTDALPHLALKGSHNCHSCLIWSICIIKMEVSMHLARTAKTYIFVHPTLANIWQPPKSAMFKISSHCFPLTLFYQICCSKLMIVHNALRLGPMVTFVYISSKLTIYL